MKADETKRPGQLEGENARLKKLLAEAELGKAMLKELAAETSDREGHRRAAAVLTPRLGVSERRACWVTASTGSPSTCWAVPAPPGR